MGNEHEIKFKAVIKKDSDIEEDIATVKCVKYPVAQIDFVNNRVMLKTNVTRNGEPFDRSFWIDFKDIHLLQFTGQKDGDGNDIYNGDIVTYNGFVVKGIVRFGRYKRHQFMNGDQPHENIGFYIKGIPEESKSGLSNCHDYPLIQHNNVIIKGNLYTDWKGEDRT